MLIGQVNAYSDV